MRTGVGQSVVRREGRAKLTGRAVYVDDVTPAGAIHGVTIRSPASRGAIRAIRFDPSIDWSEYTIVTAADIPGVNVVKLIVDDQPYLADGRVEHAEEPVLLVAHADPMLAVAARSRIAIDIDPMPAVLSMDEATEIFKSYAVSKGDVDRAFSDPDLIVVEGVYSTGAQEQLYIEPNGMIAVASAETGVTVWGSMQCPYYIHGALAALLGVPEARVRVVQMETGGGFGGKEEYPTIIAGHAALLAWKSGRPVKMIYGREEDMAATTKRHPSRTRHRTAVTRDGRLVAMDIDFTIDGGAYSTLSPVVLSRGTIHAAGPYDCPHVRVRGRAMKTNVPPNGAFRGFGAPQSIFALERQMDRVARTLDMDPADLRRRNFVRAGATLAVGQTIREPVDMDALLQRAMIASDYSARRAAFAKANPGARIRKGIGLATFMHGAGFTGSGEVHLESVVAAEGTPDGSVRILAASTEIGQGTNTIFSQIAAEALGLEIEDIEIAQPDTAAVPNSGPTVASRTCMVVGKLVESAAVSIRRTLVDSGYLPSAYTRAEFRHACERYVARFGSLRASSRYAPPPDVKWDDDTYTGDAYGTYAWAAYVAEVSVDLVTWETHVDDFVAVQEVGRVINPTLARGQIEGGVAQAIGWALYEDVVWREGRMANAQMTNYIMPTSMDLPPIRVYFEEVPYAGGPGGAKGIGELPMDGAAPAILNAVAHATGVDPLDVPLTPERMMTLWNAR